MNTIKRIFIVSLIAISASTAAMAQFAWGPKVGVALNTIHFNKEIINDVVNSENQAGFTGGIMMEFTAPVINLGFDASLMYVHRPSVKSGNGETASRDYIELPINLKYKIGLPVVGHIITPYVFTGPSFAVLVGKKEITEAFENKSFDMAWNVGLGLQFFSKLQIGASYAFGLSNAITSKVGITSDGSVDGKNRYWTVTAAWLF